MGDHFSLAWRVQGAEYWGVPQRRNRIYLVVDFAAGRAGKVLFEQDSLRRNSPTGHEKGQGVAADASGGIVGSGERSRWLTPWAYALQGNGIDRAGTARCNGCGWHEDVSYTLNTIDRHGVCYGVRCQEAGNDNPPTTIAYGGEKSGTLDASYSKGAGERGGKEREFIAEARPGRSYIVRRLTTTECARLQGFPDEWALPVRRVMMTDAEAAFWEGVRKAHAEASGMAYRPCSKRGQLIRWYNRLHTDSAEYKLWGNGIALPCAAFVLRGIANELRKEPDYEP